MRHEPNLVGLFIPDCVVVSDEHISQEPLVRAELGKSYQTLTWDSNVNLQNIVSRSNFEIFAISKQKDTFV